MITKDLLRSVRKSAATVKSRLYDRMLGIETMDDLKNPRSRFVGKETDTSLKKDMFIYGPVFYGVLKKVVRILKLAPQDIFVDLGCGKGRAVLYVARERLRKVVGVELQKDLLEIARKNLKTLRGAKTPVEFVLEDVVRYKFTDENIVFINNSFGYETLEAVLTNLRDSWEKNPRRIRVLYLNPQHKETLDAQAWLVPQAHTDYMDTCYIWTTP